MAASLLEERKEWERFKSLVDSELAQFRREVRRAIVSDSDTDKSADGSLKDTPLSMALLNRAAAVAGEDDVVLLAAAMPSESTGRWCLLPSRL